MSSADYRSYLPADALEGTLLGRAWMPAGVTGSIAGPSPVHLSDRGVHDLSRLRPTMAELLADESLHRRGDMARQPVVATVEDVIRNSLREMPNPTEPYLLAPIDLQAIKACGVTFACSLLERLIEEQAGGKPDKATEIRNRLEEELGSGFADVVPGSVEADKLKEAMIQSGIWSQYLEVGIGPYAEVFTKAQPLSAVGLGQPVGINSISSWNNPEPEIVLIVNAEADIVGATLGNDVNLRDIEGRSALLLGKAKDNNASCSVGPFIRLIDETFSLQDIRIEEVRLEVAGTDGYRLSDKSLMSEISRDITDLVAQTINESHQYPDGLALFTGSLFAPTQDRGEPGMGFTHRQGDVVRIASGHLGLLEHEVRYCDQAEPWTFGASALMRNLASRGLL